VFARRVAWDLTPNAMAERIAARRARGLEVLDLADANPTQCALTEPARALAGALVRLARDPACARYEPDPRGHAGARAAIASYCAGRGAQVGAEHVVLTAGTSEGYSHLFRLLADPGDRVHLPTPGYPLFDHLAELEGVEVARYPLRAPARGAGWRLDLEALTAALTPRSRAVLAIHPHNPTGSFVAPEDLAGLRALARSRGLALLFDEVFGDYAAGAAAPPSALAGAEEGPLHFALSGASKLLGLPQLKIAWIAVAGPAAARDEALARLEFVTDAFLSVSPLLAAALPELLAAREPLQRAIRARVAANRAHLAAAAARSGCAALLPAEAGWSAVLRIGSDGRAPPDEEALALALLDRAGVLVQPGFLFDLDGSGESGAGAAHLVVSLLPESERFERGVAALFAVLAAEA
jgi:alanine-synthesizing transaminase